MIESVENKQVKHLYKLKQKKYRQQMQEFYVEGEHLVLMALQHNKAKHVFLSEQYDVNNQNMLTKNGVALTKMTTTFDYITEDIVKKLQETVQSQGIFARCEIEEYQFDQTHIVVFDGLQDPGNVGTIIRTAQAFNIHNFYFTKDSVDAFNSKTLRSSQGMHFLSQFFFEGKDDAILADIIRDYQCYVLDLEGTPIDEIQPEPKRNRAIIVGNEARGIDAVRWQGHPIEKVVIPMNEPVESLNASIATAIMLFHLNKQ